MNGLTESEMQALRQIRFAFSKFYASHDENDLIVAKRKASAWVRANKERRAIRETATKTIEFCHSRLPEEQEIVML